MSETIHRREFMQRSGTSVGSAALAWTAADLLTATRAAEAAESPNEKVVFGLIGCGGQGRHNLRVHMQNKEVEVAALCDVDDQRAFETVKDVTKTGRPEPATCKDFREILDNKDIDAVIVGTPDHWHAIPTILACQAGKDVYVEKPVAHNIIEGRAMVDAARKYKRVVQVGTQQRSGTHFQKAVEIVRSGILGRITLCRTWNTGNETPNGIGNPADTDPPAHLDYDRWLGPAPKRPYNPNRCHYQFRWFFDYAAGMVGDWNVHLQDIIQWGMDVEAPISISATGGKWALTDNRDTPDTMEVTYEYESKQGPFNSIYSMSKTNDALIEGRGYGIIFYGTEGSLLVHRSGWEIRPHYDGDEKNKTARIEAASAGGSPQNEPHARNFLDCIKSREKPISDIEIAHHTTTACHLGNIAMKVGRRIYWDASKEMCFTDRGLTNYDRGANTLLSREYRKGYELPKV
jgi:predicted dehydrogenase